MSKRFVIDQPEGSLEAACSIQQVTLGKPTQRDRGVAKELGPCVDRISQFTLFLVLL